MGLKQSAAQRRWVVPEGHRRVTGRPRGIPNGMSRVFLVYRRLAPGDERGPKAMPALRRESESKPWSTLPASPETAKADLRSLENAVRYWRTVATAPGWSHMSHSSRPRPRWRTLRGDRPKVRRGDATA